MGAMLSIKSNDEDPRDLARRRDLWVVCHGQKLIMRILNPEYERAADAGVPLSQSGYARGRGTTEQVFAARLALEQQRNDQGMLCIGYMDCGTFFMSCVKTVQAECERWMGVDPEVTKVVRALHTAVTAQYETAHGLTEEFDINTGNGQGCVNGAVRSKLQLAVVQRAVDELCKGYKYTGYKRVKQLIYADDALYMTDNIADLQLMFDTCWTMMTMMGLQIMIKGKKKTAFMATYWKDGKQKNVDMGDVKMQLPDEREVPQIRAAELDERDETTRTQTTGTTNKKQTPQTVGGGKRKKKSQQKTKDTAKTDTGKKTKNNVQTYRYLGCELSPIPEVGYTRTRSEVCRQMTNIIRQIGRLPGLDNARMREVMEVAVQGIMGFYGRTTPFTWADCEEIEKERAKG